MDHLREEQALERNRFLRDLGNDITQEAFEFREREIQLEVDNAGERDFELRRLAFQRAIFELNMWRQRRELQLEELRETQFYYTELKRMAEEYKRRREQIEAETVDAQQNAEEQARRQAIETTLRNLQQLEGTVSLFYQNWEAQRTRELQREGRSQEEINETISKEGSKRIKLIRTLAKLNIVANTATAAMEGWKSAMDLPLPLFIKLPLAFSTAATAIAFGKAQYDAVDRDSIQGGGGGGSGITIRSGEEHAPGIQERNRLIESPATRGLIEAQHILNLPDTTEPLRRELAQLRIDLNAYATAIENRPTYITEETSGSVVQRGSAYNAEVTR